MKIKTLSIQQPWACLIAAGYKDIENRTWATNYRGKIAIHASSKFDFSFFDWIGDCALADLVRDHFGIKRGTKKITKNKHLFGAVIGTVDLIDCIKTDTRKADKIKSPWCFYAGYAWVLAEPRKIEPITGVKGKLNLWTFDMPE